jgi:hypothetical protein
LNFNGFRNTIAHSFLLGFNSNFWSGTNENVSVVNEDENEPIASDEVTPAEVTEMPPY